MPASEQPQDQISTRAVVGPRLRILLVCVLAGFAVLVLDSVYLGTITFLQWANDVDLEDGTYQIAFLIHLTLGFAIVVPALVYAILHLRRAIDRPNRLAVRLGLGLFAGVIVLLVTGIGLTRGVPFGELNDPGVRTVAYWLHVAAPVGVAWLFVLHRLAGPAIHWRVGFGIAALSVILAGGAWLATPSSPNPTAERDFFPSLARTASGRAIPAAELTRDEYCATCHADVHDQWSRSAHRFASFNNPAYRFSVRNTRQMALARDGNVDAARFCAGCHDPVPLFSGAFDDPDFDDEQHPTAAAGITCVSCHAIEKLGSPRGNADYVIAEPEHYPFAFSENPILGWINGVLIKGNPALHKRTFLKPLHRTPEFCSACHKVHLPESLNQYRWLRGQNHYDSFLLSGVSGHSVQSFYYPDRAVTNCTECHMPLTPSTDFAARANDGDGLTVHGHHFPAANTALAPLLGLPASINDEHRRMLEGALRVDLFAIREGTAVDTPVAEPLRPALPVLKPGATYLIDVVLRTLKLGHLFTEGTADSNEVWLDIAVTSGGQTIGQSGALAPDDRAVDPWSHFVNAFVIDREGRRIDRRNAEDIFTKLYDHQIPPGAADVVHYRLTLPPTLSESVEITVSLRYRKFDTDFYRQFTGDAFTHNDLPIVTIATDSVTLPVSGQPARVTDPAVAEWERWNDYGIGLLRKPGRGELRQAETAFRRVTELGAPDGAINQARVMLREGRLDEAQDALRRAAEDGAYPWSITWFGGLVDMQNGAFDAAIDAFTALSGTRFEEARRRGFDFSRDYRLRNTLAQAQFERAKLAATDAEAMGWLQAAADEFNASLALDPENVAAHYGLAQTYTRLGDSSRADHHREHHERYRRDDNAHDSAIAEARRRYPAANLASEAVVIYDLQRRGPYRMDVSR